MKDFKGTKGKWNHFDEGDLSIWSEYMDKVCEVTDKRYLGETTIETEANAKLISKAPEMLEMLQSVVDLQADNYGRGIDTHLALITKSKEIQKLIREATE